MSVGIEDQIGTPGTMRVFNACSMQRASKLDRIVSFPITVKEIKLSAAKSASKLQAGGASGRIA